MLAAGLKGIEEKYELSEELKSSYNDSKEISKFRPLPMQLNEALSYFE
jgi:glutamine synthetase